VVSTKPADSAPNVSRDSLVSIWFSEPIIGYGGANVTITEVGGGEVPFTRGYFAADNRLTLNPFGGSADLLDPGTTYEVTLTGGPSGIRSAGGVPLATQSFTFTTTG
jgi:hypothetical protein